MRLAIIVPGGVDRSGTHRVIPCLLWLIERLARSHDVQVFALYQEPHAATYPLCGATIHAVARRFARLNAVLAVLREHRRQSFDLIHAFWALPPGVLAAFVGVVTRRPVLLHLAGGELQALTDIGYGGRLTWRGRFQVRVALWGANRITAATPGMARDAGGLGVTAQQLVLGVDLKRWPAIPPRERPSGRPARLIHVASLNRVKDQATLLRAIARLRDGGVSLHLDIVGQDTLNGVVQRLASSLGLDECVTFHGFLPHDDLQPLMARADLHVMSSRHEGGEVVTLEAAVCGLPTVGTRVGHVARWAPDAAVAVAIARPDALADGLAQLLDDDAARLRLAREAQRRALADDADATASRVNEIYQQMIGVPAGQ
ncbi:MAG: glycosyltransferase [Gemmatimonadales bacterium]